MFHGRNLCFVLCLAPLVLTAAPLPQNNDPKLLKQLREAYEAVRQNGTTDYRLDLDIEWTGKSVGPTGCLRFASANDFHLRLMVLGSLMIELKQSPDGSTKKLCKSEEFLKELVEKKLFLEQIYDPQLIAFALGQGTLRSSRSYDVRQTGKRFEIHPRRQNGFRNKGRLILLGNLRDGKPFLTDARFESPEGKLWLTAQIVQHQPNGHGVVPKELLITFPEGLRLRMFFLPKRED